MITLILAAGIILVSVIYGTVYYKAVMGFIEHSEKSVSGEVGTAKEDLTAFKSLDIASMEAAAKNKESEIETKIQNLAASVKADILSDTAFIESLKSKL